MRKILSIIVILLLSAVPIFAAKVTNISVSHQPGITIARIELSGQVRYTHQTEVPKDGRGHRVIVDLLAAKHELGQKEFLNLPTCLILSMRTSQFAVSPEQIVRVVFDVKRAPLYRVESDKNSVTIYFTDKKLAKFATWQSKTEVSKRLSAKAGKTVQAKTKPSTKVTTVAASPKKKSPAKTTPKAAPKRINASAADNEADQFAMNNWVKQQSYKPQPVDTVVTPKAKSTSKVAVAPKKNEQKVKATSKKASSPVVAKKTSPAPSKPMAMAAPTPKSTVKQSTNSAKQRRPVVVVKDKTTSKSDNSGAESMPLKSKMKEAKSQPTKKNAAVKPKSSAPKAASGQNALASKISGTGQKSGKGSTKAGQKPTKNTRTSRFRRSAGQGKITGTMVAEFPRRLVIKYKGGAYRDPFETLINATRSTSNPVEKIVPNIEGLRLVGVVESDSKVDRALFEDNDGFGYILRSGDKVRNGYVLRVESDRVYFQIFEYGWSRTVALQLQE